MKKILKKYIEVKLLKDILKEKLQSGECGYEVQDILKELDYLPTIEF